MFAQSELLVEEQWVLNVVDEFYTCTVERMQGEMKWKEGKKRDEMEKNGEI